MKPGLTSARRAIRFLLGLMAPFVFATAAQALCETRATANTPAAITYNAGTQTITVTANVIRTGNIPPPPPVPNSCPANQNVNVNNVTFSSPAFLASISSPSPGGPMGLHTATATIAAGTPAGTYTITARYNGSPNNEPTSATTQVTATLTINKRASSIVISSGTPNPTTFGQAVALTATVSSTSGTPTGTVNFFDGATNIGSGTLSAGVASLSISTLSVGAHSITAVYAGDTNYLTSTSGMLSRTVNQASQALAFTNPGPQTFAPGGTVGLSATGGASGNPVTFASNSAAVCTVAGSTVTFVSAGTCSITANQAGNTNYAAAAPVMETFAIGQASQTISFTNPGPQTFSTGGTVALSATGGASGNAVIFTSNSASVCTVAGSTVTMLAAGTCSITATQAGNTNFAAATPVTETFAIGQAAQTIAFANPGPQTFVIGGSIALSATGGPSGNAVTFASNSAGVCTVSGSTVTMLAPGICSITANQAGSASYTAAAPVTQTFAMSLATVFVQPGSVPNGQIQLPYSQTFTASGGTAPYTFAVASGALPPGLTLSQAGVLSGTPTALGNFAFVIVATDANTATGTQAYTIAIGGTFVAQRTSEVIRGFLQQRADVLTSQEPERWRNHRRFEQRLQSQGAVVSGGTPQSFANLGDDSGGSDEPQNQSTLQFAASLSDLNGRMGLGAGAGTSTSRGVDPRVDLWVEGRATWFDNDDAVGNRGRAGLLSAGADYLVMPGLLIGTMVQLDHVAYSRVAEGGRAEGDGWMAGPYLSAKLSENLFVDMRAAWGQASNDVAPFDTYNDQFDSTRWLLRGDMTGNWELGALRFTPSLSLSYFEETSDAYIDSNGIAIRTERAELGRLALGPEFGYAIQLDNGTVFEPFVGVEGLWDFVGGQRDVVSGEAASGDDFRVKVRAGFGVATASGATLRASGAIDGIDRGEFTAYSAELWLSVPLN